MEGRERKWEEMEERERKDGERECVEKGSEKTGKKICMELEEIERKIEVNEDGKGREMCKGRSKNTDANTRESLRKVPWIKRWGRRKSKLALVGKFG